MFYFVLAGTMGNLAVHNHPVNIRIFLYSFFALILQFSKNAQAQNLVPNGDFEYYSTCPTDLGQAINCNGWRAYHLGSSDYFNACHTSYKVNVPANNFGYQLAASGNAYMGGWAYTGITSLPYYTEYIASPITPMTVGITYEVSMSVSLANESGSANNGLGVWFYDIGPSSTLTTIGFGTLPVNAQIQFSNYGIIADTQTWVRVVDTFTADSAYDNIVIGKFNPSVGILTIPLISSTSIEPYYYIDSVVVRSITPVHNLFADSIICTGDTFRVPYTVNVNTVFATGNIFNVELSDASGSFISPIIIGSSTSNTSGNITCFVPATVPYATGYRLRITASTPVTISNNSKNITIQPSPTKPSIIADTVLCEGDILHLSADSTTPGAAYEWIGPDNFTSTIIAALIFNVKIAASGTYILTVNENGCMRSDTAQVLVKVKPEEPIITSNAPLQTGQNLNLNLQNPQPGVKYTWTGPNGFTSYATNPIVYTPGTNYTGSYIITAYLNGCINSSTIIVQIDRKADTGVILLYPSPNDGTFYLKGVFKTDQHIPLRIFDVNGQLVYADALQTQNKKLFATIPLKNRLASGEYLLHILIDGRKRVLRFTVIR